MPEILKLLVAEDSEDDAFLLERALQQTGVPINATFVTDGQEAVNYVEGSGEFSNRQKYLIPAVIMLDLKMPRLDGFDVLGWLKSQPEHRRTPVIVFSSSDDRNDIDRAYNLGASCFLTKPAAMDEMPDLVRVWAGMRPSAVESTRAKIFAHMLVLSLLQCTCSISGSFHVLLNNVFSGP